MERLLVSPTRRDRRLAVPRRAWRRTTPAAIALCAIAALAACGDGGGGADDRPAAIEAASPTRDTVEVGADLESPLQVRVTNSRDDPLEGVSVRFQVVIGPGEVSPSSADTRSDGRTESVYGSAERVGQARVEADLPQAPDAGKAVFEIRVVQPTSTRISALEGDGQQAERESQLARPFEVEVRTPGGAIAGGIAVGWRVLDGPAGTGDDAGGARLLVDTTYTNETGRATNLLTLGDTEGEYRVSARSTGAPDSVEFTATAVDSLEGDVALDSVVPRPLVAEDTATLYGSGFSASASSDQVWIEGTEATVVAATAESLRVLVPDDGGRCLPARTVGVRVEADGTPSNGLTAPLNPAGGFLDLGVGELRSLPLPDESGCIQLESTTTDHAYRVVAQSTSRTSGSVTPMRLVARSAATVGATASAPVPRALGSISVPPWIVGAEERGLHLRTRIQERAREELLRQPARRGGEAPMMRRNARSVAASRVPDTGDTLDLFMPVDRTLSIDCSDTSTVMTAVVREVGDRVALLEDTLSPDGGLTEDDLATLAREMDDRIFPVDTSYFGGPADIDDNERVLILLTPEVNKLTPSGSEAFVGGFFLATDLVDSGDEEGGGVRGPNDEICPSSNEAEVVYLATADPNGTFGIRVSRERAIRNARSVSAHELEHLLSAEQRMVLRGGWVTDLESTWLDEALAHLAEGVAGFSVVGLDTRSNLTHSDATRDPEAFEAFFFNNFARAGLFMQQPGETSTLAASDPGGLRSLRMRGFGWLITRWLGDHFGPSGSGGVVGGSREELLFRELSSGGADLAQGIENVRRALETVQGSAPTWEQLLADFAAMLPVDDDVPEVPPHQTLPTWNLRDLFRGIHQGPRGEQDPFTEAYPLQIVESAFTTAAWDFDVNASGQVYFEFASGGDSPALSLALQSQAGGDLPAGAGARFTIIRVR